MVREISDKEALEHYKKYVIDAIIADGKDPDKLRVVKLVEGREKVMIATEIHEHIQRAVRGLVDPIGREELEKHKRWMLYKIKRGQME